jgi:O-antigen ligase
MAGGSSCAEPSGARPGAGVGLLLAGSLCLLPFLIPYHQPPILSFYPEWLAAALGVAASLAFLAGRGARAQTALPASALWLWVFAAYLAMRAALGDPAYPQSALVGAAYVLFAALLVQLGAQLSSAHGVERVGSVLAACVLAGALANAAAGLVQFYGRPALLEDLVADLRGARAYGNIAQVNLYANYLALGQAALILFWPTRRPQRALAIAALALLALGSALSGSRSALLYAVWLAALGALAPVQQRRAAYLVAAAVVIAHLVVPWLNAGLGLGPASGGTLERLAGAPEEPAAVRWPMYGVALKVFAAAPLFGVGWGEFAGAAFAQGLAPSLTQVGEVWSSPHNLPLHLLADSGLPGAALVLGALWFWAASLARRLRERASPALWWMAASVGVALLHSLIEFPLWSAHFLGPAALLVGASALPRAVSIAARSAACAAALVASIALTTVLALTLRDYVRLDTARVTGTTVTMASPGQAARDARTMHELADGLLGPVAELWTFVGAPLDREQLARKLAMSERVARYWPAHDVIVRRAVFLALSGDAERARALLVRALASFPRRRADTLRLLERAREADPAALGPLLALAAGGDAEAGERGRAARGGS